MVFLPTKNLPQNYLQFWCGFHRLQNRIWCIWVTGTRRRRQGLKVDFAALEVTDHNGNPMRHMKIITKKGWFKGVDNIDVLNMDVFCCYFN